MADKDALQAPIWAHAPRNATHWGPRDSKYSAAWYAVSPSSIGLDKPALLCLADNGSDRSGEEVCYHSERNIEELIPRPLHPLSKEFSDNDIDNW